MREAQKKENEGKVVAFKRPTNRPNPKVSTERRGTNNCWNRVKGD